jgi:hypothetical protein
VSKTPFGRSLLCAGCAPVVIVAMMSTSSHAVNFQVAITVDNSYALFYGTQTAATNFVGTDFDWTTTETYNFDLPDDHFIYVVTASDLAVAQAFLGQFNNLGSGLKFYSSDPQWQVMATGLGNLGAPYTGSAADLALLTQEILDANGGGNASGGWVGTTPGPVNGGAPWGLRPGIDAAANWVWYSSNGDPDPTTPGFNHDEWLVFRISVAVPEPGTLVLFALGLVAMAARRESIRGRSQFCTS